MRKVKYPGGPVVKVVPRDQLVAFFIALIDAVPDCVWRIEDTKLLKGRPRSVSSSFIKTGNALSNNINNRSSRLVVHKFDSTRLDK